MYGGIEYPGMYSLHVAFIYNVTCRPGYLQENLSLITQGKMCTVSLVFARAMFSVSARNKTQLMYADIMLST